MSTPESSSPFDLLDAAMRDPFLQQAFRLLDQRHLYGIIPRVCHNWHDLSTTSTSSMTVKISTELKAGTGQPDAAISYSEWLQRNIAKITSLDLSLEGPLNTFNLADMLHTISSATHLCDLRLSFNPDTDYKSANHDLLESFAGMAALSNLTSLVIHECDVCPPAISSISVLTQLRALDLTGVGFPRCYDGEGHELELLPELISSLGDLTRLTLNSTGDWNLDVCVPSLCSLAHLVELDIRRGIFSSSSLQSLQALPIAGIWIALTDSGHVSEVAGLLERCIPTRLKWLTIQITSGLELQSSQVSRLLAPLRSAGSQLQGLYLDKLDLSQADVSIITGLTQLKRLDLVCNFDDGGWALLEPAFAHLELLRNERDDGEYSNGMSRFRAGAAGPEGRW